ncbi:MAG: hypothetical protein Q9227_004767 [Pyrenula ochraceoflavens]
MGGQQSRPDMAINKALVERLKVKDEMLQQQASDGFVYVENCEKAVPAYRSGSETISISTAEEWQKELMEDPKNRLAMSALLSTPLNQVVSQKVSALEDKQVYNIKIPFEGAPITNQRSSGRCWLFAATNVFRVAVMKKHGLKEFELSQAYFFFWDKLEKSNFFLQSIMDTADQELDSRLIQSLLASPIGDGGQWDMVANLVAKYGIVPQSSYPDSYNAMNSSLMDSLITTKLREHAITLRSMIDSNPSISKSSLLSAKDKMLQEVHLVLTLMLGPPPNPKEKFTWEYYDNNNVYHKVLKTPLELANELSAPSTRALLSGADVNKLFSLVNDPRNKYNTLLTVDKLGNVYGGRPITYVNVGMDTMKKATIAMLKAGLPVFFGSDVGKYSDSSSGIMDTALFDYSLAFNVDLGMSKAQRLMTGESAMTHAMVLTAVHVENGKSIRWRVQNSWGTSPGDQGWFLMSDKWMDEFTYQVVVDPRFVDKEIRDILSTEPKVLPLWDPMGALA